MLKAIILAAGESTRMKSSHNKVMHKILGKPLLGYEIDALKKAGVRDIIVVVGNQAEEIKRAYPGVSYATQEERLGTGHAAMMAIDFLDDESDVLLQYGDMPLLTPECFAALCLHHRKNNSAATVVSAVFDNPFGYGRIIRDETGDLLKVVEQKDATPQEDAVKEINTGLYCFKSKYLKLALSKLSNKNSQKEYYITDTLEILRKEGYNASVFKASDPGEFYGINDRVQLYEAAKVMQRRINNGLMQSGVTIIDRETAYISPDAEIGRDTIIYPGVTIEGASVIGEGVILREGTRIENSRIGDFSAISSSLIVDSLIGSGTTVGPYAHIRAEAVVGDSVRIGNFVEIKKSVIGNETKSAHLTYIGDADVGERVNFGCGSVVVNYDGKYKYKTTIGDDVFIGCNVNLLSPIYIADGAFLGAGSTITEDVPKDSLAIARSRQINKIDWKKKKGML